MRRSKFLSSKWLNDIQLLTVLILQNTRRITHECRLPFASKKARNEISDFVVVVMMARLVTYMALFNNYSIGPVLKPNPGPRKKSLHAKQLIQKRRYRKA